MAKQQRRVFLKVIAVGSLVGCAGTGPEGSLGGSDGSEADAGSDAGATAGKPAAGGSSSTGTGGKPVVSGGTSSGGNPFVNGGANTGGNPFASAGGNSASSGGSSANTGGTPTTVTQGTFVGNLTAFPVGWFGIAGSLFFLGRDAAGIYAMSMQCTHQFCALVMSGPELDCPCHKSRFDRSGNVLQGPATTPLPYYKVFIDGAGNVSVDKYSVVSRTARTPV